VIAIVEAPSKVPGLRESPARRVDVIGKYPSQPRHQGGEIPQAVLVEWMRQYRMKAPARLRIGVTECGGQDAADIGTGDRIDRLIHRDPATVIINGDDGQLLQVAVVAQ
jgi:hypothetical protein